MKQHTNSITLPADVTPSHSSNILRYLRLAVGLTIGATLAFAQSVTITPSNSPTVATGGTQQFTANATGFTIAALKWEVANVQSGSAATGTITTGLTGGLFTAPAAIPAQNPETLTVVATDTNGIKYSATIYVSISLPPPVITAVTPNPLPVGTSTVTITGNGFTSSSLIWDSGVQYATQQPTANTLTASVYTGAGTTSATFTVHSSGTVSNAFAVPVGSASGPPTYTLTVLNGSGSGNYTAGTVAPIAAKAAPAGQQFQSWTGAAVANALAASTTLTMPAANTTVTATYAAVAPVTYALTVVNGSGSGSYAAGTVVNITANAPLAGQQFQSWTGAAVASATSPSTTLAMPAAATTVAANYSATQPGSYTVTYSGSGSTSGFGPSDPNLYAAGQGVTVLGNIGYLFNSGHSFVGWNTSAAGTGTSYAPGANLSMGSANVTLYPQWNNQDWPVSVWGGARNAIVLKADGTVWTWGLNSNGQLGDGTTTDRSVPVQVLGANGVGYLSGITAVMGGELHNLALKSDGTVWAWGRNANNQLGDGNSTDSSTPVQVSGLTSIVSIASRGYHSVAVKSDGTVWAWGLDEYGALGNGVASTPQNNPYPVPVQVQGLSNPLMVSVGYLFSVALMPDHTLVAWGNNANGELGDGTTTARYNPAPVQGINNVIWVSAGWDHVVAIKSDGSVWTWGANTWAGIYPGSGMLGDGTTADHYTPEQVAGLAGAIQAFGGDSFTSVLLHDGTVWTFGSNGAGQLGTGSFNLAQSLTPVQVQGLGNVTSISGRDHHNQAIRSDGTVWSWGSGENGELGNGTMQNSAIPVEVTWGSGGGASSYTLTVVNGSGSGSYAAGAVVNIAASAAPAGQQFQSWTGAAVANASAASTTLTMPAASTTVTATYASIAPTTYTLTVVNGSGSGSFAAGAVVTITANAAPSGQQFQSWTGSAVANALASSTTVTMPAANTTVTASYAAIAPTTYTLTVVNGTGSGSYAAGAVVAITANTAPSGQQFQSWTGATVANASASSTSLTMPAANATVTAGYVATPAGLTITSVSPNPLPTGTVTVTIVGTGFNSTSAIWDGGVQYSSQQPTSNTLTTSVYTAPGTASATFTVHSNGQISNAVTVPVSGPPTYTLTVLNGSGSGSYTAGTPVTITANAPPAGQSFTGWTGATVANANAATTSITMPAASTTVTANYASGPTYPLTVVGGQGSGNYPAGTVVAITANNPAAGQSFLGWTGGTVANANSSATTITMPAASTTVTANFSQPSYTLTVVNGLGSGNYAPGTIVQISASAPPAGQFFQHWTGVGIANTSLANTTITMPQANTTVTASFYTPTAIPFPVSTHPRLWVTQADLPRLQGWATGSNPMYGAVGGILGAAIGNYYACFPGATLSAKNPTPAATYPDLGDTQGYSGILSEEQAVILAFNSLIDPNPANRIQYAQAARNLIMYALNQAALGPLVGAPFRDPEFSTYNRASYSGQDWPLVVDWIYNTVDANGNPILTAADKAVVQNVFMQWAGVDAGPTDIGANPTPEGVLNSLALVPYRWAANNYFLAHARNVTMMGLAIDPADDPAVNPLLPPSSVGNSLRSYILNGNGAWLYEIYAMMGDPQTVAQAYGASNNPTGAGFGLASGGLPPEGFLYGESFGYVLGNLLALQTAGFNNPALSGPQIALIGAPVWDRYVQAFISSLTPTPQVNPAMPYLGAVYQFAGYGDMLNEYVTPDFIRPWVLLALLEQENGQSTHVNEARWFTVNAPPGGAAGLQSRVVDPWTWGSSDTWLSFLLLDPAAPPAADPRPNYPTLFYDPPQGRIVAHTDWTPTGTMFDYRASWQSINHQDATGGQFELFRNGEWLTKEMSNYDNNGYGSTTVYHNTLAIQNWCSNANDIPATLNWIEPPEWINGSQWMWGASAGDPTTVASNGPGYVYAASDLTKMYNRPSNAADAAMDVTQATRSLVWLSNVAGSDYVVVYDRASTIHNGFKRFNLSLVNAPMTQAANGVTTATELMNDGQQLFINTLLPQNAATSFFNGAAGLEPIANLEPTKYIYQVQDPSNPTSTRFLHVLQGANSGTSEVPAAYVKSTSGTAFDGAAFGANAVYFPVSTSTAFAGTTLPAPAGVHSVMVAGLAANGGYSVSVVNNTVTITVGGTSVADSAGMLTVKF